ncbi:MAG: NTP transferase domain-containing protein, partial [Trueperaceae bacterium]
PRGMLGLDVTAETAAPTPHARHASSPKVTVVVLAGGDATDVLAARVGAPAKALVPLKGRPLGAYVLDALVEADCVARVVWVGALDAAMRKQVDLAIPGGPRMVDSMALGAGAADAIRQPDEALLFVTADIPWLRGSSVDRFVRVASPLAPLVYPVVGRAASEATFPGMQRTWIRLADGDVTGGNLLLVRPEALRRLLPWVDFATRDRKSPLWMAWQLGPGVLLRLVTGRASLAFLERHLSRLIGTEVRAYLSDDPVLGTDVDRPEQLPATLELADLRPKEPPTA